MSASALRYKRIVRFLNSLMAFLTVVPVFLLELTHFGDLSLSWTLLGPFAAILLAFLLREFCTNLILFTIGNLLCLTITIIPTLLWTGASITPSSTWEHLIPFGFYLLFGIGMIILNYVLKYRRKETWLGENLAIPYLAIPCLTQIICLLTNITEPIPWILICAVIQILLRFINVYLLGHLAFLAEVHASSSVPLRQIFRSNNCMLSLFFLIASILMTIVCAVPTLDMVYFVLYALAAIERFILMILQWLSPDREGEVAEEIPVTSEDPYSDLAEDAVTSPIWLILEKAMIFIIICALVIGAILLLYYIITRILKAAWGKRNRETDLIEFLDPFEKKGKLDPYADSADQPMWKRLFGTSAEQRIRKSWYKTVRHRLPDVSVSMSPGEITRDITQHKSEQQSTAALQSFYEKARYSNQECTKEDVAAVKQLAGKLKSSNNMILDNPLLRDNES